MWADSHSNRDIRRVLVRHFDVLKLVTDSLERVSELADPNDRSASCLGPKPQPAVPGWTAPDVDSVFQDR